jgi:hypothetical protein
MTWTVNAIGHLANPEEEQEISDKVKAFIEELAEDTRHVVTGATFSGTYSSWWKNQADLEPLAEKADDSAHGLD